jgi:hypothetical protein
MVVDRKAKGMAVDATRAGAKAKKGKGGAIRGEIAKRVEGARRRLGRGSGRDLWRTQAPKLALLTGAVGVLRPWVWPLPEAAALAEGPVRTLGVMAAVFTAGSVALVVAGRRRGPSALGAARALDAALGRAEVVASGYAFEGDGRDDAPALLAREHAREALEGARPEALFTLPRLLPPFRKALGAIAAIGIGLALGSYHPALRGALLNPPREDELEAASLLKGAAEELAKQASDELRSKGAKGKDPDPASGEARMRRAAELARSAAQAAQRGDRNSALSKLASLRAEGEQARQQARALASLVRSMKESLPAAASSEGAPAPKSASSLSEGLNLLSRSVRQAGAQTGPTPEEKRALERLERGASDAAKGASSGPEAKALAEALERARQAMLDGNREAAAAALEAAAKMAAELEARMGREGASAEQVMALLKAAGLLEGKLGSGQGFAPGEPGGGEPGGPGMAAPAGSGDKGASLRARLAALGLTNRGQGQGGPGPGGGHEDPAKVEGRKGIEPSGSVRARSAVGEGERAVKALAGLGRGAKNAPAYKEVFPSYDAAVEEGLADERIPAARRVAVRRYFESIRPGEGEKQGDDDHPAAGAAGGEGDKTP